MVHENEAVVQCRAILEEHSKSFSLAARLLPRTQRDAAAVVYAWCRRVDDAVDEAPSGTERAALRGLFEELDAIEAGTSTGDVVVDAFSVIRRRHSIPMEYARELVRGMEMDVEGTHYQSLDDLLRYCHRVAGVVGLMMCHVMGLRRDEALVHAAHLGWGMQLTNICRDVLEDWQRGRLYLPESMLVEAGWEPDLQGALPRHVAIREVVALLLAHAEALYRSGDAGLIDLSPQNALAVDAARRVYAAIGGAIARQRFDVHAGRAYVRGTQKAQLVLQAVQARGAEYRHIRRPGDRFAAPGRTLLFENALEHYSSMSSKV